MKKHLGKADLAPGALRAYPVSQKLHVVVANLNGRYAALDDWCNHSGCSLAGGKLEENRVVCPCHSMEFDMFSGQLCSIPRLCEDQRAFAVAVEGDELFVEIPDGK